MKEYHVHIITIGFEPEPSMDLSGSGIPADKAYLLNDPSDPRAVECGRKVAEHISSGNIEVAEVDIDCYDFYAIYDKVLEIAKRENVAHPKVRYHINFSRGTAIAVSAVCCAAFELNSQLYYVKYKRGEPLLPIEERVIPIDIENIHDQVVLTRRTKEIFLLFKEKDEYSNSELLRGSELRSKGSLKRYTQSLESNGLVEPSERGKEKYWTLTGKGRKLLKRMDLDSQNYW